MQVQGQNPYTHLMQYQRPASEGPAILPIENPADERPQLTPEQKLDLQDRLAEKAQEIKEGADAQRDAMRELTVGYVGMRSKQTQWEIYLSGMSGEEVDTGGGDGVQFYNTLREIHEQNNAIKAYAAYRENALGA